MSIGRISGVVVRSAFILLMTFLCLQTVHAQPGVSVENLGAPNARLLGGLLVYSQWESFQGVDLNGDGDTEDRVAHVRNLSTGETTNLRLAGEFYKVSDDYLVVGVDENAQGEDLNGDGDRLDSVVHIHNRTSGETTNLKLAGRFSGHLSDDYYSFSVSERSQGEDLNGDGDTEDRVRHQHNLITGETTIFWMREVGRRGDLLLCSQLESFRGEDLNGDGDTEDWVFHVRDISTNETTNLRFAGRVEHRAGDYFVIRVFEQEQGEDVNGDGDNEDEVFYVHNLATGETTKLRLAVQSSGSLFGEHLVFRVAERKQDEDLNGDGDSEDLVVHVHNLSTGKIKNLKLAGGGLFRFLSTDQLGIHVSERAQGADLNGDGDTEDVITHVHDLSTGVTTNLRISAHAARFAGAAQFAGDFLVLEVLEQQSEDLNGDGDTEDQVVHVHNHSTGVTTNLRLAASWYLLYGDYLVIGVSERNQGEDLNLDGDHEDLVRHIHQLSTAATTNLGGRTARIDGNWLVYSQSESILVEDLNGDGDTEDHVVHVHNHSRGVTTNLRLAGTVYRVLGDHLVVRVDGVVHIHNLSTDVTTNTGLAGNPGSEWGWWNHGSHFFPPLFSDYVPITGRESGQGEDLNDDGDTEDWFVHVHKLSTGQTTNLGLHGHAYHHTDDYLVIEVYEGVKGEDLNGDGDSEDEVFYVHNFSTGQTTNLGLISPYSGEDNSQNYLGFLPGGWLVIAVSESRQREDLNGDTDSEDLVCHLVDLTPSARRPTFLRGDCNADGTVDVTDAESNLGFQFLGDFAPTCEDACDFDDSGIVDVTDAVASLTHQFLGTAPPAPPGKDTCGVDPTDDALTCESFAACPAGG